MKICVVMYKFVLCLYCTKLCLYVFHEYLKQLLFEIYTSLVMKSKLYSRLRNNFRMLNASCYRLFPTINIILAITGYSKVVP